MTDENKNMNVSEISPNVIRSEPAPDILPAAEALESTQFKEVVPPSFLEIQTAQMGRSEPLEVEAVLKTDTAMPEASTAPQAVMESSETQSVTTPEPTSPTAQTPPSATQTETAQSPTGSGAQPNPAAPVQPDVTPSHQEPAQQAPTSLPLGHLLLAKAGMVIQFRKRKKLEKIMTIFAKKSHITNDEVEKLLHVSDATATRYLSQLEKEGKIRQEGKIGKAVSYSKI